jgi:hypothetical protein
MPQLVRLGLLLAPGRAIGASGVSVPAGAILDESGSAILDEAGGYILEE